MIVITYQREKCIGCNYCEEMDPANWRMSRRDGKSTLLGSTNRKGFHTVRLYDDPALHQKVAEACPQKIIKVKEV